MIGTIRWEGFSLSGERDAFSTFLISAAVAGVSIGGTWVLGNFTETREVAKQNAQLMERVDTLMREVRELNAGLSTVTVLTIRVDRAEKQLDKQEEALRELRDGRVPRDMRDR